MSERLRVNPITCEGHGLCAELLPELIRLDDWGYPIIEQAEVPPELMTMRGARSTPARRWRCSWTGRGRSPSQRSDSRTGADGSEGVTGSCSSSAHHPTSHHFPPLKPIRR
jgi:ferredoxin